MFQIFKIVQNKKDDFSMHFLVQNFECFHKKKLGLKPNGKCLKFAAESPRAVPYFCRPLCVWFKLCNKLSYWQNLLY
jgi:hypothetical protein